MHKPKENCGVTLGLRLVSDGDVPSVLEEWAVAFAWWFWKPLPGWGNCADIWESCGKGCRKCQFLFLNPLVCLCCAGGNDKETENRSTRTAAEPLCFFLIFFFFLPRKLSLCSPAGSSGNNVLRQFITLSLGRAYHCYIRELLKELLRSRWLFENLYQELTSPAFPCS